MDFDPVKSHATQLRQSTRVLDHEIAALNKLESDEHESNSVFVHLAQVMYLEKKLIQQFLELIVADKANDKQIDIFLKEMRELEEPKKRLERALGTIREYEKHMNTLSGRLQETLDRTNLLQRTVEKHLVKSNSKGSASKRR